MDEQTAVKAAGSFETLPKVRAWAQQTIEGDWDLVVEAPGHRRVTTNLAPRARALYRQYRLEIFGL